MHVIKKKIHRNKKWKKGLGIFAITNLVLAYMVLISIPRVMDFSNGMKLLEIMPAGYTPKYVDKIIFCLNPQKTYVSFYVGKIDKVENARKLLKEFSTGKGCIRKKRELIYKNRILRNLLQ